MSSFSNGGMSGGMTAAPGASIPNLAQTSSLGSTNQGWLHELAGLGYTPNGGSWQPAPPPAPVVPQPSQAGGMNGILGAFQQGSKNYDGGSNH